MPRTAEVGTLAEPELGPEDKTFEIYKLFVEGKESFPDRRRSYTAIYTTLVLALLLGPYAAIGKRDVDRELEFLVVLITLSSLVGLILCSVWKGIADRYRLYTYYRLWWAAILEEVLLEKEMIHPLARIYRYEMAYLFNPNKRTNKYRNIGHSLPDQYLPVIFVVIFCFHPIFWAYAANSITQLEAGSSFNFLAIWSGVCAFVLVGMQCAVGVGKFEKYEFFKRLTEYPDVENLRIDERYLKKYFAASG